MDMNKTFFLAKEDRAPKWHVIDATDRVLGRMSTEIADILRGKTKAGYTPHTDSGDYVVVINCEKVKLTGNKWEGKIYPFFSGWRSGLKEVKAKDILKKDPTMIIKLAVKRMLPKNKLSSQIFTKLKVYAGSEHPHKAQIAGFKAD